MIGALAFLSCYLLWLAYTHRKMKSMLERVQGWMDRIKYKPNFRMNCWHLADRDEMAFYFIHDVPDVDNVQVTVPVQIRATLKLEALEKMGFEEFVTFARCNILKLETHEMHEWLKVDGERQIEPHPERHYA